MIKYVTIGAGGFLGAIARYLIGNYIADRCGIRFPYGTFVINMTGSFLIGLVLTMSAALPLLRPEWRYLIAIGFIGAYTTFSTFEYETLQAVQNGQIASGLLNVVLSVTLGLAAVWAGATLGRIVHVARCCTISSATFALHSAPSVRSSPPASAS